jgi:hypothetical protein
MTKQAATGPASVGIQNQNNRGSNKKRLRSPFVVWCGVVVVTVLIIILAVKFHLRAYSPIQIWLGLLVYAAGLLFAAFAASKWRREPETPAPRELQYLVDQPETHWFDLLRLEYEKGADRYENIYKAIWQNFSYSAVLAAAILTFGANQLRLDFLSFVALAPLIFWFIATFRPLNHYGEQTRQRLKGIESDFNDLYFAASVRETPKGVKNPVRFQHFTRFGTERPLWRVSEVITTCWFVISLAWLWLRANVLSSTDPRPFQVKHEPSHVTVELPQVSKLLDSIQHLGSRVDSVGVQIHAQEALARSIAERLKKYQPQMGH